MKKYIFLLDILLLIVFIQTFSPELALVYAQPQLRTGTTIDRIVAIVGNEIIMQSSLDGEILLMAERDQSINIEDTHLRQLVLDELINRKILVVKAEEDSITVSDEMLDERWEMYMQELLRHFGSVERVETVYKKTINRLKLEAREDLKKLLMSQQLESKHLADVSANPKDIEDFYETYKDSLPLVPEQIELYHIVKYIHPDTTSKLNTYELARSVRDSILNGVASFDSMAVKYSDDPGSAREGGDLGWVTKGKFVQEFERAAYTLQAGEISLPVESPFGFHVIKLVNKQKDSIHTKHILFKIEQSETDIAKVKHILDSIRILANSENFSKLAMEFSEEKETKGFGGLLGKFTKGEIPSIFLNSIKKIKDGEVSETDFYSVDPTKPGMHIILKKSTISEHYPTIATDYDFLKRYATEFKRMKLRKEFIDKLRSEIYWEIIPE